MEPCHVCSRELKGEKCSRVAELERTVAALRALVEELREWGETRAKAEHHNPTTQSTSPPCVTVRIWPKWV